MSIDRVVYWPIFDISDFSGLRAARKRLKLRRRRRLIDVYRSIDYGEPELSMGLIYRRNSPDFC